MYALEKKGSEIIHKQPRKSITHQLLEHLQHRKTLTPNERTQLETLQKGFSGEMKFYQLVTGENTKGRFLFDLLFTNQGTEFQIDSLHIDNNTLILYEIKHFSGDFFIQQDKWYLVGNKQEIRNPLIQLQRSEFLLRDLLKQALPHLEIKAYLVFVHESFMLYQVPLGYPAIFPSQLARFQQSIKTNQASVSNQTKNIAHTVSALDIGESRYAKYPVYSYDELKKGIVCSLECGGFLQNYTKLLLRCPKCKTTKSISSALEEAITEYQFLFPERNITTGNVREWCNNTLSKSTILRFLNANFNIYRNGRYTYYKTLQ